MPPEWKGLWRELYEHFAHDALTTVSGTAVAHGGLLYCGYEQRG